MFFQTLLISNPVYAAKTNDIPQGYEKIADTDSLILYFNEEEITFIVEDKRSGYLWSSSLTDDEYNLEENSLLLDNFNSLFVLSYTDLTLDTTKVKNVYSKKLKADITVNSIENGVSIKYFMEELKLSLVVEIYLEDDSLKFRIPIDGIEERIGLVETVDEVTQDINEKLTLLEEILDEAPNSGDVRRARRADEMLDKDITDLKRFIRYVKSYTKKLDNLNGLQPIADEIHKWIGAVRGNIRGSTDAKGILTRLSDAEQTDEIKKAMESYTMAGDLANAIKEHAVFLREQSVAGIVSIELLPYFGAANDYRDGYVFYPDGSGAITYFKEDHPIYYTKYSKDVYSDDKIDLDTYDAEKASGLKEISLPLYGIKKDDNALMGIAVEGESSASISYYPSGFNRMNLNRGTISYRYRREYEAASKNKDGFGFSLYEKDITPEDHEAKYIFLTGDEANYSGMANRYRRYLLDTNKIQKSDEIKENIPLALDLFMGIIEERILIDKLIPMTTFEQARVIIEELKDSGIEDMQVNLLGWMKDGYEHYPLEFKPERALGGEEGLEKLSQFAKEQGVTLFLEQNFVDAFKSNGGFSTITDVIRKKNNMQLTDKWQLRFLLSPSIIWDRFINFLGFMSNNYPTNGITFQRIGSLIYRDYSSSHPYTKQETSQKWTDMVAKTDEELGVSASRGGNQYILNSVDRLMDIPIESTGYFFTDEDIPFYQMVVHGLIPYSSQPFNLFYDQQLQKLKAIEYGNMPYYQLTYGDSVDMKYTAYSELFTSKYDNWKEDVIQDYKEINNRLGKTASMYMIKHEKIKEDVYQVTYEEGIKVIVNYSDVQQNVNGNQVAPMDYLVID